jgi:hypothetical protein
MAPTIQILISHTLMKANEFKQGKPVQEMKISNLVPQFLLFCQISASRASVCETIASESFYHPTSF